MPSGVASPACSAIVQQFLRGRSASNANRNPRTRRRHSIRPNQAAIRASSSSTPADQPAGPTLARATTAGPSDVLTPDDGHAVAALFSPIKIKRSTAGVLGVPSSRRPDPPHLDAHLQQERDLGTGDLIAS